MKKQPIGFMDSGVGGLTVLKEARQQLPNEDLVFIGDQARLPYGEKPASAVRQFAWQMTNFLLKQEIKALVIACNTATAAALPDLQAQLDIPVIGVIVPGSRLAASLTTNQQVGVIATTSTIQSQAYQHQLTADNQRIQVTGLAAPEFVAMVEANQLNGTTVQKRVERVLQPIAHSKIDTLVLGCTHFPLLASRIQQAVGPRVRLVDPAVAVIADLKQAMQATMDQTPGVVRYFTTGPVDKFEPIARQWLHQTNLTAQQVNIEGEQTDGPQR